MDDQKFITPDLEKALTMLIEFSRGNFGVRENVAEEDNDFNAILSGLNMLGEELEYYREKNNEQHNFLQNILTNVHEVVYARTLQHNDITRSPFSFISSRSKDIIGYTHKELNEDPSKWMRSIHPDDAVDSEQILQLILRGKELTLSYRIYNNDKKEWCWIEDRVVPKKKQRWSRYPYLRCRKRHNATEKNKHRVRRKEQAYITADHVIRPGFLCHCHRCRELI